MTSRSAPQPEATMTARMIFSLGLSVLVAGCAAVTTDPIASLRGQSPAQIEQDQKDCLAIKDRESKPSRDTAYVACMVARGYEMYQMATGRGFSYKAKLQVQIFAVAPKEYETARDDLVACEARASAVASEDVAARTAAFMGLGIFGNIFDETVFVPKVLAALRSCLEPRGYSLKRWSASTEQSR